MHKITLEPSKPTRCDRMATVVGALKTPIRNAVITRVCCYGT